MTPTLLLYVDDVARSVSFYAPIVGFGPAEQSPNFAIFIGDRGPVLSLWARHDVQPAPTTPGGIELNFRVPTEDDVIALRDRWAAAGTEIVQEPTTMDFGYTFTARDPDGHRLRVFKPS